MSEFLLLCLVILLEALELMYTGRSFAIVPEGAIDIGDDNHGGYGGPVLQELMRLRKEAGDFLTG